MRYTVNDFLNLPILNEYSILSGADTTHIVEHICVTEPPAEGFVRKNEIVLSTLIACKSEQISAFLNDLALIDAAALVLSVKSEPDEETKKIFSECKITVILIPWEYRFAEIVEEVLYALKKQSDEDESRFSALQKNLLQLFMDQKTLFDAADAISKSIGIACILTDMDGKTYGSAYFKVDGKYKIAIELKNKFYGYIILNSENVGHETEYIFSMLMKYAILPLSLWFEKTHTNQAAKQEIKNNFIWSIASGTYDNSDELKKNAAELGIDLDIPYFCAAAKAGFDENDSFANYEQWLQLNNAVIQTEILKTGSAAGRKMLTTFQNGIFILYIQLFTSDNIFNIYKFLDNIEMKIKVSFPRLLFAWGVSELSHENKNLSTLYVNAKLSLDICFRQKGYGFKNCYNDTGLFRLLCAASAVKDIDQAVHDVIGPLVEHDRNHGQNFIGTLSTLFENGQNTCKTSRALFIHRQTLLYRIKKIESLTGMSLSNHDDAFMLETCIRLYSEFYYTKS